jgi:hypothetical protein
MPALKAVAFGFVAGTVAGLMWAAENLWAIANNMCTAVVQSVELKKWKDFLYPTFDLNGLSFL